MHSHCVEDLQFVVDFENADQAFDTQERVAEFARTKAPRILDEVFDQHSTDGEVWRLPMLDIDLGAVAHDELESQWEARLRERLAEALLAERVLMRRDTRGTRGVAPGSPHEAPPTPAPRPELHSREQAQLDTLLHFLRHGHLPWHAPQHLALASPLGQLAHEVLRDNAAALVQAWRASPEALRMVQRAARQFPRGWLARLAHELARGLGAGAAASWGHEAGAWVDGFVALWTESRLRPAPAPHLLWEGLLSALWSDAGVPDRSQPLQSMVQALAPAESDQAAIWHALQAVARRALDGTPPAPTATLGEAVLRTCLAARVPALAHVRASDNEPQATPGSRSEEQARLLLRLQAWLPPNAHDDDLGGWHELLQAEPSWAREVLLQLGRSAAARQRMAQALPAALLLSLMALWLGPTEQGVLQAATDDAALWGPATAPLAHAQRWERTLAHVLGLPAPALFNGADYLDHLIAQRGEREHQTVPELLRALDTTWRGRSHDSTAPMLRAWLRARRLTEAGATTPLGQRRARLEAALAQGLLAGVEDDWHDALRDDSAWLQDRLRQAGRRPSLQRRMAREWSRLARTQLIGLWLLAPERAAVVAALDDPVYASLATAGDSRPGLALWEDLIAHLMRLTPGSFFHVDAYLRGLRERLADATAAPAPANATDERPTEAARADDATWLVQLPPAEQWMLRQEMRLVQQAAQHAGLPASDETLSQLVWAFAKRELVDEGRRYEPVAFPARLARHLVDALHLPEPDAWLARIAAEAGRQKRPDTAPRIAAAITAVIAERAAGLHIASTPNAPPPKLAAPVPTTPHSVRAELVVPMTSHSVRAEMTSHSVRAELVEAGVPLGAGTSTSSVRTDSERADSARTDSARTDSDRADSAQTDGGLSRETLHVANAGIVLAGAYLPRLFGMLQLTRDEAFVSPAAAERAVLLMHHLATGSTEAPEPQLALHKVLCGIGLTVPLIGELSPTPEESQALDGLLQAMIAHWKIIGHTTVAGLRESFLQREGRLSFDDDDGWQLTVEPRSYDMLLDHLPWGYSLQKFPWMERPLHVEWR